MPNAVSKIKQVFIEKNQPLTLAEIKEKTPDLKASEISMALCYFNKNGYVTREKINNKRPLARKTIYEYTFYPDRVNEPRAIQASV